MGLPLAPVSLSMMVVGLIHGGGRYISAEVKLDFRSFNLCLILLLTRVVRGTATDLKFPAACAAILTTPTIHQ